jgi:hypothetical protein
VRNIVASSLFEQLIFLKRCQATLAGNARKFVDGTGSEIVKLLGYWSDLRLCCMADNQLLLENMHICPMSQVVNYSLCVYMGGMWGLTNTAKCKPLELLLNTRD